MPKKYLRLSAVTMAVGACLTLDAVSGQAAAQQECFLAETRLFAGNFAPRNWAYANGQILPIAQNQALFSLLGTTYGGDGRTSFALPDLRGRVPVGPGQGGGLTTRTRGEKFGVETNTLTSANLPSHTHGATTMSTVRATSQRGTNPAPAGNVLGDDGNDVVYQTGAPDVDMNAGAMTSTTTVGVAGGVALTNVQPTGALNYIICTNGIFPSRN